MSQRHPLASVADAIADTRDPLHGSTARRLRIAKTFAPGHDGTRRLAREIGDRLYKDFPEFSSCVAPAASKV
jgi:Trk K+ transport system NAD-binding subunit